MNSKSIKPGDRFNHLISDYRKADRQAKGNVETLLAIINRLNAPWEQYDENTSLNPKLPSILTSLAGETGISTIRNLISHPFFYRLNFIKQLGLVHLSTNLDASHNRLAHCVGTAQCAVRFLQSLSHQEDINVNAIEERAVLFGAFIHDSFHGPFGHSLEMLRDVFLGEQSYRRLDKCRLLEAINNESSKLNAILNDMITEEMRVPIREYLQFFFDKINVARSDSTLRERYFLAQIIDSDFDSDRIDFVMRDSKHLGLGPVREEDKLYNVIEAIKVLTSKSNEQGFGDGEEQKVLCFSIEHRKIIDEFLARRRDLYLEYYENPTKLILDDMLAHVVFYILDSKQVTYQWWPPHQREHVKHFLSQVQMLTDDGLIHFIYEAGGDDAKSLQALHLLNDLLGNRPFIEIAREEVEIGKARSLEKEWKSVNDEFEESRNKVLKSKPQIGPALTLSPDEQFNILSDILDNKVEEVTLLYFAFLFSGGFLNKFRVEQKLWSILLNDKEFKEIFNNYLSVRYENSEEQYINIQDIPYIHIALPTYAASSEREIHEYATEPTSIEKIAYYDSNDDVQILTADLPRREDLKKPIVILSTCGFLAYENAAKEKIVDIFRKFLYTDKTWLNLNRL